MNERPGLTLPLVWLAAGIVGTIAGVAIVGAAAYNSESGGIVATNAAAFPLGALWGGSIGAWIAHFALRDRDSKGLRIAAPFGCGCLSGVVMLLLSIVFFAAIFPAL